MTDTSPRYRPSARRKRSLREIFTLAARHYRLERRSESRAAPNKLAGGRAR